jgi:hypothetical protein
VAFFLSSQEAKLFKRMAFLLAQKRLAQTQTQKKLAEANDVDWGRGEGVMGICAYHARVEQPAGDGIVFVVVDPVVPDLHFRGAADFTARQGTEPHALSGRRTQAQITDTRSGARTQHAKVSD